MAVGSVPVFVGTLRSGYTVTVPFAANSAISYSCWLPAYVIGGGTVTASVGMTGATITPGATGVPSPVFDDGNTGSIFTITGTATIGASTFYVEFFCQGPNSLTQTRNTPVQRQMQTYGLTIDVAAPTVSAPFKNLTLLGGITAV